MTTRPSISASGTGWGRKSMQPLTRKRRPWNYLLPAIAAVLVIGGAVWPRPALPVSHRRFTSPTFADGARYTLLYPATLDDISLYTFPANSHGKYLQSFSASKKESRVPGMTQWHRWFRPETEFVFVSVEKPVTKPLKSSRVQQQGARNSSEIAHRVYVDDPRAREHFMFGHVDDFGTAAFNQHDRAVAGSFCVLLPGEAVPNP